MRILIIAFSVIFSIQCEVLKIHLIPHSHQDPGWLTTIEGYYYGTSSPFGECVKCVIERVFKRLKTDNQFYFTWAELAFLKIWFSTASNEDKELFGSFLSSKKIDFVNGGFVTNDEACSYYEDIIEQLTYGNRFLKENFNYIPKTAWHIDPFGHSNTMASIFSQAGFESFFIERSNEDEMNDKKNKFGLEYIWNPSGSGNYIFTHYNYLKYGGLDETGYCMESVCNRWRQSLDDLATWFIKQRNAYPSQVMLLHVGKDFSFGFNNDNDLADNIEELVQKFNGYKKGNYAFEIYVSTPSNYTKAFFEHYENDEDIRLQVKEDDNFPYIEDIGYPKRYWTGYFSSRPHIKLIIRQSGFLLQTYRKIFSQILLSNKFSETRTGFAFADISNAIDSLEQAVSLSQHHDGVSGTAKSWVERDYADKIFSARKTLNTLLGNYFKSKQEINSTFLHCPQNISFYDCEINRANLENKILVNIFNPGNSGKKRVKVKIPVKGNYRLSNPQMESDIFCFKSLFNDNLDCELYFEDEFAFGETKSFTLESSNESSVVKEKEYSSTLYLDISETAYLEVKSIDPIKIEFKYCRERKCVIDSFSIEYFVYQSAQDSAYILWTWSKDPVDITNFTSFKVYNGKLMVCLLFSDKKINSRICISKAFPERGFKVFTEITPLSLDIGPQGEEVIMRVSTKIQNRGFFKTDSNGLLLQKRKLITDSGVVQVARNYYPVSSQISLEDDFRKLVIVNDRSQGGSSQNEGQLELMIHRRVMSDGQGLGEYLDDREPTPEAGPLKVSTEHTILILDSNEDSSEIVRNLQFENENALFVMYAEIKEKLVKRIPSSFAVWNPPQNVKYSIRPYEPNSFMLRLVNLNENSTVSFDFNALKFGQKINLLLTSLSGDLQALVEECEEVTITTVKKRKDVKLRKFRELKQAEEDPRQLSVDSIFMKPLQVRTFMLKVNLQEGKPIKPDEYRLRYLYGNE